MGERIRAVFVLWAWQTLVAATAAFPAGVLVRSALAGDPDGGGGLARAGSRVLLSLLAREEHGVRAVISGGALVLVVGGLAGLFPLAILFTTLDSRRAQAPRRSLARAVALAWGRLPTFAVLGAVFGIAQVALAGAGLALAQLLSAAAHVRLGEARSDLVGVATGFAFATGVLLLALVHDLARAASVRGRLGAKDSMVVAVECLWRAPLGIAWAWAWRTAASWVAVLAVWALGTVLSGPGVATLAAMAVAHQGGLFARLFVRASWLANALRSVAEPARVARRW